MSLFEWIGESVNPGPVGTVDVGGNGGGDRPRGVVLVCFAIALVLLVIWGILLVAWHASVLPALLGTVVYLCAGYFVHPRPDLSNVGWLGGLFDHPFRYSDDVNRFLILLVIVLWPGRFVAESLVAMARLLAREWRS